MHGRFKVKPGSIIIMHEGTIERATRTSQTLDELIPSLKAQGYIFVTLNELYGM